MITLKNLVGGLFTGGALAAILAAVAKKKNQQQEPQLAADGNGASAASEGGGAEKMRAILDSIDRETDTEKAISVLEEAVKADPGSLVLNIRLAEMYAKKGNMDAAEKILSGIKDPGGMSMYYRAYGDLCVQKGDFERAEELLNEAMKHAGDDDSKAHVHFSLARMFRTTKDLGKAKENVRRAIELSPRQYFSDFLSEIEKEEAGA